MTVDLWTIRQLERLLAEPSGIDHARRYVLELAIRGQLTARDHEDEPAAALLAHIEEARRARQGTRRRTRRHLPPVSIDDRLFDVPPTWEWARLRDIADDRGQGVPTSEFTYIDVSSIDGERGVIATARVVAPADAPSRARKLVDPGDVLYSCVRPYLRNIAVVESGLSPTPIASTAFAVLDGYGLMFPKYLWLALRSPSLIAWVESRMRGQAYPAINDADLALLPLPVPPRGEQERIVVKVEGLFGLCDQVGLATAERSRRAKEFARATVSRLTRPVSAGDARKQVTLFLSNLGRIGERSDQVPLLRHAVRDLAVQGRLVDQDPRDERASELLDRIRASGAHGVRHSARAGSAGDGRDEPVGLPPTWDWATLGEIAVDFRYGTAKKSSYDADGEPILRIPNVSGGRVDTENIKFAPLSDREVETLRLHAGDLLIIRSNGSLNLVGRAALVQGQAVGYCYAGYLVRVRPHREMNPEYVLLALNTTHVREQIEVPIRDTVGLKNVNTAELSRLWIPVPPTDEQARIVRAANELLELCDDLETELSVRERESQLLVASAFRLDQPPSTRI